MEASNQEVVVIGSLSHLRISADVTVLTPIIIRSDFEGARRLVF